MFPQPYCETTGGGGVRSVSTASDQCSLELSTGLRESSQCLETALILAFLLLKVPTIAFTKLKSIKTLC